MATYTTGRSGNPAALGLTLALNGAVVAALVAWNPSIIKTMTDPIWVQSIPAKPDAVPPPPEPDQPRAKSRSTVDTPERRFETSPTDAFKPVDLPEQKTIVLDPGPVITPDPGPAKAKAEPAPPVRVAARLDTRHSELQPPYPPALQRAGIEGSVTVRVHVGPDGRPLAIMLVRADDPGFFAATERWGLRNWRFTPATEDGRPVESSVTLTVRFTIQ